MAQRVARPPSLAPPVVTSSSAPSTDRQAQQSQERPRSSTGSQQVSTPPPERAERSTDRPRLPDLPNILWEWNQRGGVEAWFNPAGATRRAERRYLGYFGLRQIRAAGNELDAVIAAWAGERLQAQR